MFLLVTLRGFRGQLETTRAAQKARLARASGSNPLYLNEIPLADLFLVG